MIVRQVTDADHPAWAEMRRSLFPDDPVEEVEGEIATLFELDPPYTVFVADDGGRLAGFIELWQRSYAEGGPATPSAYIEGLWVEPAYRRRGVAQDLLEAAETWARGEGFTWLGSDAQLENAASQAWHGAAGFAEIERVVVYGKQLG